MYVIFSGWSAVSFNQKNSRVHKISVRNSGAGNGCANFMPNYGHVEKLRSFCRKTHVHKIPRFGGGYFAFWGGGSAHFIFMGARIFLI